MTETIIPTNAREVGERDGKKLYALGASVIDEDELRSLVAHYRDVETSVMLDRELNLGEAEVGNELMVRAAADLRSRGIAIENASGQELLDSLKRVSP